MKLKRQYKKAKTKINLWLISGSFIKCHHCQSIHVLAYGYVIHCIDCELLSYYNPPRDNDFLIMVLQVAGWIMAMVLYEVIT